MTKREVIEDLIKNTSGPVTIKYLARLSRSQKATVNCIMNDMQDELLVECIGRLDQERLDISLSLPYAERAQLYMGRDGAV